MFSPFSCHAKPATRNKQVEEMTANQGRPTRPMSLRGSHDYANPSNSIWLICNGDAISPSCFGSGVGPAHSHRDPARANGPFCRLESGRPSPDLGTAKAQ